MSAGKVLAQTIAGGVTINDTLWHFAHKNLPFGGVGASGIGAYHGEASFLAFTHRKPVFVQPRFAASEAPLPAVWRDVRQGACHAEEAERLAPVRIAGRICSSDRRGGASRPRSFVARRLQTTR
jgi:hypothetical protein